MGQSVSWLSNLIWAKKEIRILILGLVRYPGSWNSEPTVTPYSLANCDRLYRTMLARQLFYTDSR
jgi:hypothetical protein